MARILMVRANPIAPDPRVEKEAKALARGGHSVRVLGWDTGLGLPREEKEEFGTLERLAIPEKQASGLGNVPHLLRFQIGLTAYLLHRRKEYDWIHACDFDTLLPSLLAKLLLRKRVMYDVFDLYGDRLLKVPAWLRKFLRFMELKLMRFTDGVILADKSRTEQIRGAKPPRLAFVYNAPELEESFPPLPPPPPPFRVGYVGLLSFTRGIREMMEAVGERPNWVLEMGGYGGDEEEIRLLAQGLPNVHFHGRMAYKEGLALAASSHLLFATYDPRVPNNRFSSANKLFEAMALGRPIVVARGTSMDRIVEEYGLGFVVEYGDTSALKGVLQELEGWTEAQWETFSERARRMFRENFSWPKQADNLLRLYAELEGRGKDGGRRR